MAGTEHVATGGGPAHRRPATARRQGRRTGRKNDTRDRRLRAGQGVRPQFGYRSRQPAHRPGVPGERRDAQCVPELPGLAAESHRPRAELVPVHWSCGHQPVDLRGYPKLRRQFLSGGENANAIAWRSRNSQVATVSESGSSFSVEFEGAGSTTVSATADECVYGPDATGSDSVDECLCQYLAALQAAPVAVTATCPVPTGEVTTSDGWSFPAVHRFEQRLTPFGTSFVGRWVSESDAAPATDSCWFQDSNYDPMSGVSGGAWRVTPGNNWGPDSVGYDYTPLIWYYREQRPMNDLPMPCGWTVYQRLEITSCGPGSTASVYRPSVTLGAEMSLTEVSASRDGIEASRVLLTA